MYLIMDPSDPAVDAARVIEAALPMNTSHDALRGHLSTALRAAHGVPEGSWTDHPYISNVFPGHVVYSHKGQTLKRSYTKTDGAAGQDPTIKVGDAKPVHVAYMDSKSAEAARATLLTLKEADPAAVIITSEGVETVTESVGVDLPTKVREAKSLQTIPVKLIAPGWGSMAYYPKEVLQRDGPKVFKAGTHMMWNHGQESGRPEGDLNDLAAVLTKDAAWNDSGPKGPGLYSEAKVFSDYATQVAEKGAHIGVSINAGIRGHEGTVEGRSGRIADSFVHAFSTDFVTKAGAGGAPIVPVTEAAGRAQVEESSMTEQEQAALVKENADLKTRVAEMERGQNHIVAVATVGAILREAEVPFRHSLLERACGNPIMKEGKPDPEWVKSVVADFAGEGGGKVTGAGDGGSRAKESDATTTSAQLKEALKDLGVPEAGLAYAMEGRA